jgi:hypothetical protein
MSSRRESEFARLEQLLREADERAEQERRRAEEADERAEQERRRAEDEGKKTRPTTFEEYIRACHTLLSKPLRIQTDKSLTIQGSISSPKNKPCPILLKPRTDFPVTFNSAQDLTNLGQDICDKPLASEKDLEAYQRLAVKRPTTHML